MSKNSITGDEIKSKVNTKEYEEGYDRIFGTKSKDTTSYEAEFNKLFKRRPQSLDAAYERLAMMQGMVINPLFDENKELVDTPLWTEEEEKRVDIIGSNGPDGLVYEKENKDVKATSKELKNEDP